MSSYEEDIRTGDFVAVRYGLVGRQEGLVVGSHIDWQGRQVIEVQLDGIVQNVLHPHVSRIRRTISYSRPSPLAPGKVRTVERRIIW